MARHRLPALLLAAPLILLGCNGNDPAGNNAAEAENRAVADLLEVDGNSFAAADEEGAQPNKAAPPQKAKAPTAEPARRREQHARRAGERG